MLSSGLLIRCFLSALSASNLEACWFQIVEGFRGALLADTNSGSSLSIEGQQEEENFDLALLSEPLL